VPVAYDQSSFNVAVQVKSPFSSQLRVTVRILFAVEEAGIATSGTVRCLLRQHCLKSIHWVAYSEHGEVMPFKAMVP
jgi:hypothetical protein